MPLALAAAIGGAACCATSAFAQHSDIVISLDEGRLATAALEGAATVPARVFPATFGDTGIARFTSNPGFEASVGTFLPGSRTGFNALSGLSRFDGSGLVPATDERLEAKFLTLVTVIGTEPVGGFDLAVQSDGGWHRHLNYRLFSSGGKLPSSGVYVVEFELYSTDGVTLPSEPFWIVFNDGRPQAEHDAAIAWANENLAGGVPACPSDLDANGTVDASDLAAVLAAWGGLDGDLDGDGLTGAADLATLLAAWGPCP
jgi:hypothetical protein